MVEPALVLEAPGEGSPTHDSDGSRTVPDPVFSASFDIPSLSLTCQLVLHALVDHSTATRALTIVKRIVDQSLAISFSYRGKVHELEEQQRRLKAVEKKLTQSTEMTESLSKLMTLSVGKDWALLRNAKADYAPTSPLSPALLAPTSELPLPALIEGAMRVMENVAMGDLQQQQQKDFYSSYDPTDGLPGMKVGATLTAHVPSLPQTRVVVGATMLLFERLLSLTFPWPLGRSHYQHKRHLHHHHHHHRQQKRTSGGAAMSSTSSPNKSDAFRSAIARKAVDLSEAISARGTAAATLAASAAAGANADEKHTSGVDGVPPTSSVGLGNYHVSVLLVRRHRATRSSIDARTTPTTPVSVQMVHHLYYSSKEEVTVAGTDEGGIYESDHKLVATETKLYNLTLPEDEEEESDNNSTSSASDIATISESGSSTSSQSSVDERAGVLAESTAEGANSIADQAKDIPGSGTRGGLENLLAVHYNATRQRRAREREEQGGRVVLQLARCILRAQSEL